MKEQYWTTKDGRKIAVGDMTLEHLRNVLRMLLKQGIIQSDEDREINGQSYTDEAIDEINMAYGCHEWWK